MCKNLVQFWECVSTSDPVMYLWERIYENNGRIVFFDAPSKKQAICMSNTKSHYKRLLFRPMQYDQDLRKDFKKSF